ncbi:MAG: hypothetical protein ACN4GG_01245 [Akkermansiaceae bacterium]
MKTSPFILITLSLLTSADAQTIFNGLSFDFSEAAFTSGGFSGSQSFNIIDDATGAKLTSDNGDLDDITITVTSNVPGNASGAFADAEFLSGGGLKSNHGFSKNFSNTYATGSPANPGTEVSQTFRVTFANHLNVTDFETDFSSMNTRGRTWEHSQVGLFDENGAFFSSEPSLGNYLSWQNDTSPPPLWDIGNEGAGNGASGSPSQGWFVAASTATVTNVGSALSGAGSNGSRENMTGTNGDSVFKLNDVGLADGTRIGGYEWTIFVEDTRGASNNSSSWTTTQTSLTLTSTASVPEPSSALLAIFASGFLFKRKR